MHFLGTTPGGTRIIYDRNTLMHYRNSPLAKTPPGDFPVIPGVTAPGVQETIEEGNEEEEVETPVAADMGPGIPDDEDVFPMEN